MKLTRPSPRSQWINGQAPSDLCMRRSVSPWAHGGLDTDQKTRLLLVDFSLYNVNTNLVAITRCGLLASRCSCTEHRLLAAIEFDISGLPEESVDWNEGRGARLRWSEDLISHITLLQGRYTCPTRFTSGSRSHTATLVCDCLDMLCCLA